MEFGMKGKTDEELDRLITEALHSKSEDFTSASERLKERIDKEIAVRAQELSSMGRTHGGKCSFAMICLNLFEGIEVKAKRQNVVIRCLPKDNAFEMDIVLKDYEILALEYVLSELVGTYSPRDGKVLIFTEGTAICIKGLNVSELNLGELCAVGEKTYTVDQSDMGIAISFLQLRGIDIRVSETKDIQIVFCKGL